jgi:transglutaminase-like putative cysteine protease
MRTISHTSKIILFLAFVALTATLGLPSARAQAPAAWPPVPPEELALKDNAFDPGSPAMILEYEVQTDNAKSTETVYKRIKIFREEGKKFADVEIRYWEKLTKVEEIRARVTSPSGKPEDFNGTIYDKEVVKFKKFLYNAKTFTLPNVDIGAVIEYSYRLHWHSDIPDVFKNPSRYLITEAIAYPAAEWEIQQEIPVRHGRFTLHPIKGASPELYSHDLPKDTVKTTLSDGTREVEVNYIPAFQKEEYSPPEENLKIRADLFYTLGWFGNDPRYYWRSVARREAEYYDKFIGKPKDVRKEVERLVSPGDSDETKLRKIYARVQQIRALSFEPEKTKKERKQESLKENKNVEEVLNRGYAFGNEINLAFIALARAAGFQAYPIRLAARNRAFFIAERLDPYQLNSLVAEVIIGSTSKFFDPATIYCPYNLLPWEETDTSGIRVDAQNSTLKTLPLEDLKDTVVRRDAEFQLDAEGNLSGKLSVVYEGQEALQRRLRAIDQDEAERRKELEDQVQNLLPRGGRATLLSAQAWTDSEKPLKAEFEIQVPNYANKAGQRLLMPVGVFHLGGQQPFASTRRTYAVYLDYPWESYEQVKLALPPGFQIESLPSSTKIDRGPTTYESSAAKQGSVVQLNRTMKMAAYYVPVEKYSALKQFYELIRAADEQQAVLKPFPPSDKQ